MRKMLKEFRDFAVKGNVVDMAVGVIIGGAFGKIVTSLVSDIIMPAISAAFGGTNFTEWKWVLKEAVMKGEEIVKPAISINYGNFIQIVFDFIIIAFSIFMVIKGINKMKDKLAKSKKEEVKEPEHAKAPEPSDEAKLLAEIRDLLKKN